MRYLVPETAIPPHGRQVRCANCRHSWHQDPPSQAQAATPSAPPPPPVPPSLRPEAERIGDRIARSNRPLPTPPSLAPSDVMAHRPPFRGRRNPLRTWSWIAGGLAVLLVVLGLTALAVGRAPLARLFGLPTVEATPLVFVDNRVERGTFGGTRPMLIVSAKVLNVTSQEQPVPSIVADGVDANGRVVFSWTIPPPQPTIAPGERVAFSSGQSGASDKVTGVDLSFKSPAP